MRACNALVVHHSILISAELCLIEHFVGRNFHREWDLIRLSLLIELRESERGIYTQLIDHVEGRADSLSRELQSVLEDGLEVASDHPYDLPDVRKLSVQYHAEEVKDKEDAKQTEQMHPQLVAHRQLVPPNAFPYLPLDSPVVIDVLPLFKAHS